MMYIILSFLCAPVIILLTAFRRRNTVERILLIQTAKIGDMICATPLIREIKKHFPGAELDVMLNPITRELLEVNPHVDRIISVDNSQNHGLQGKLRLAALIRKNRYDTVVCLNPNVTFAFILFWGLIPLRLSVLPSTAGLTYRFAARLFSALEYHDGSRLVIESHLHLLRYAGIVTDSVKKEVYASAEADTKVVEFLGKAAYPLIGMGLSSGNKLKELGVDKVTSIINALLNSIDGTLVLIGSAQDEELADTIRGSVVHSARVISAAGKFSLKELPALLKKTSLYIGVDSGITYMADALDIPLIHLAGPIDTVEQRPYGENVVVIQHCLPCVPCTQVYKASYVCKEGTRACIRGISPEEILAAASILLSS